MTVTIDYRTYYELSEQDRALFDEFMVEHGIEKSRCQAVTVTEDIEGGDFEALCLKRNADGDFYIDPHSPEHRAAHEVVHGVLKRPLPESVRKAIT